LSPSNRKHDLVAKRRFYARVGVPEYWIVDPDAESVEVLELAEDARSFRPAHWARPGERVRSRIFDLDVDVAALFRD
jgi:Uma2 family endonuclease